MRFLHLMMNEKFTQGAAHVYDSYFDHEQHEIGYVISDSSGSVSDDSLTIRQHEFFTKDKNPIACVRLFRKLLKQYDYIVLHSFFVLARFSSLLYLLPKSDMKKLIWIEWGADLYDPSTGLKKRMRDRVKKSVGAFVAIFPPDADIYRKTFPGSKAKVYCARYLSRLKGAKLTNTGIWEKSRLQISKEQNEPVYVLIGQNNQEHLNHIDALKALEKYKDENIRVVLSLSYGGSSDEYVETVSNTARSIFGDKAILLTGFMPKEEYFELTKRIDIAIFNTTRQSGLGNINRMLFRRVKLYLRADGTMYDYYLDNGFPVQDFASIGNESFDQFSEVPDNGDYDKMNSFFDELADTGKICEDWKKIYRELENQPR